MYHVRNIQATVLRRPHVMIWLDIGHDSKGRDKKGIVPDEIRNLTVPNWQRPMQRWRGDRRRRHHVTGTHKSDS